MLKRSTYFCVCDGQQEELYLNHIAKLITRFPEHVLKFNTTIGCAKKLKKNRHVEYDSVAVFDHDNKETQFKESICVCQELNRAGGKGKNKKRVYHAYSNLNIDLWFILHKEHFMRPVTSNDAYVPEVRRIYHLGSEADIKQQDVIKKILEQINLDDVRHAIKLAEIIRSAKPKTDAHSIDGVTYYNNPDFSIHDFLRKILEDYGEW